METDIRILEKCCAECGGRLIWDARWQGAACHYCVKKAWDAIPPETDDLAARLRSLEAAICPSGSVTGDALVTLAQAHREDSEWADEKGNTLRALREKVDAQAAALVRLRERIVLLQHGADCDSRFASTCGDNQRCSCGLDAVLSSLPSDPQEPKP